jgi:hypothetical protein
MNKFLVLFLFLILFLLSGCNTELYQDSWFGVSNDSISYNGTAYYNGYEVCNVDTCLNNVTITNATIINATIYNSTLVYTEEVNFDNYTIFDNGTYLNFKYIGN